MNVKQFSVFIYYSYLKFRKLFSRKIESKISNLEINLKKESDNSSVTEKKIGKTIEHPEDIRIKLINYIFVNLPKPFLQYVMEKKYIIFQIIII
jgi:hypothetical protein